MTTALNTKILTTVLLNQIASVCHETNRQYCATLEEKRQRPWDDAPEWQCDSARKGVSLHWAALEEGKDPLPEVSHHAWLAQKKAEGWSYGEVKDETAKTHPCFLPYHELPAAQRLKDYLFVNVVKAFFFAQ